MTVVVQAWAAGTGRWAGGATMIASSVAELHDMADLIGLQRDWFHSDPKFPHYDLTNRNRKDAIEHGAIQVDAGDTPDDSFLAGRAVDGRGPLLTDPGVTMTLPGMGPEIGSRHKSRKANVYCTVMSVQQRRYCWITVRVHGESREIRLDEFQMYWQPV
jgi:hypothetical protein